MTRAPAGTQGRGGDSVRRTRGRDRRRHVEPRSDGPDRGAARRRLQDGGALVLGRYRLGAAARIGRVRDGLRRARRAARPGRRGQGHPRRRAGAGLDERAQREALAAARLDHPGDRRGVRRRRGRRGALPRLRARRGPHARRARSADGALSDRDVLRIGLALADALAHAHDRGVIHRDVKPQNVIVPDAPRRARAAAKLTDFGVAHLAGDEPLTRDRRRRRHARLHGARAGRRASASTSAATSTRSRSCSTRRSRASTRCARGSPAATARRVGTVAAAARRAAPRTCRRRCARRSTAPCCPTPTSAATLDDLGRRARGRAAEVSDEGGTVAPHPLERRGRALLPRRASRRARRPRPPAGSPAAALRRPRQPAGRAAARARPPSRPPSLLLPRAGWALAAVGGGRRAGAPSGRASRRWSPPSPPLAVAAAARARRPRVVAARRRARCSASPALAGAYPALAGRARRARTRAALGAARRVVGCCSPSRCSAAPLVLGTAAARRRAGTRSPAARSSDAAWPLVTSGAAAADRRCGRSPRSCCPGSSAAARSPSTSSRRRPGPPGPGRGDGDADRAWSAPASQPPARPASAERCWRPPSPSCCLGARRSRGILVTGRDDAVDLGLRRIRVADERPAQPRVQARRPRRGHVLARLQVRGAPGRDRAQARQRDGRAQGASRCRATYAPNEYAVWLSPDDRKQFEGYEDDLRHRALAATCSSTPAASGSRSSRAPAIDVPHRRAAAARRVRHPGAARARRPTIPHEAPSQGDEGHTMVYSASERLAEPLREPDPAPRPRACCASTGAPSCSAPAAPCSAARATATSCSTTRTSPAATPRSARPAARGSSATSAPPTASRSTAAASRRPAVAQAAATSIELGTSRVTFELE